MRKVTKEDCLNIILMCPESSYLYAKDVIKGRFEAGEPIIATSPEYAYQYAKNVLGGRFEAGEESIINSDLLAAPYIKFLLDNKTNNIDELEELFFYPAVKQELVRLYVTNKALYVINYNRNIEFESILLNATSQYIKVNLFNIYFSLLNVRLHELEDWIMGNPLLNNHYVQSVNERMVIHEKARHGLSPKEFCEQQGAMSVFLRNHSYSQMPRHLIMYVQECQSYTKKMRVFQIEKFQKGSYAAFEYAIHVQETFPHLLHVNHNIRTSVIRNKYFLKLTRNDPRSIQSVYVKPNVLKTIELI